jgi:phage FluMu protein Com
MFEIICWSCGQLFGYEGEQYRDITCPHCQVMNSVYNPEDKPLNGPDEDTIQAEPI